MAQSDANTPAPHPALADQMRVRDWVRVLALLTVVGPLQVPRRKDIVGLLATVLGAESISVEATLSHLRQRQLVLVRSVDQGVELKIGWDAEGFLSYYRAQADLQLEHFKLHKVRITDGIKLYVELLGASAAEPPPEEEPADSPQMAVVPVPHRWSQPTSSRHDRTPEERFMEEVGYDGPDGPVELAPSPYGLFSEDVAAGCKILKQLRKEGGRCFDITAERAFARLAFRAGLSWLQVSRPDVDRLWRIMRELHANHSIQICRTSETYRMEVRASNLAERFIDENVALLAA